MNMEATTLDTPLTSIWLEEIVGIRCLLQGSEGLDDSIARNAQSYWPDSKSLTIPQPLSKSTATILGRGVGICYSQKGTKAPTQKP